MPRKQDRYADKAANQIRINGETITAKRDHPIDSSVGSQRPVDQLQKIAQHAQKRRQDGEAPLKVGIGSFDAVFRAAGN